MNKFKGLMTSLSPHWATPKGLYDELNKEFNFNDDPCPLYSKGNGLNRSWNERVYLNPPYGKAIGLWIRKGYNEYLQGKLVVMLLPSRTDTKWFHEIILPNAKEIRFIKGRLHFNESKNSAPFPSCIVIFSNKQ